MFLFNIGMSYENQMLKLQCYALRYDPSKFIARYDAYELMWTKNFPFEFLYMPLFHPIFQAKVKTVTR